MNFPLDFWNISLMTAITAIILLVTSEMLSPNYGKVNIKINRKKLGKIAVAFSIVFLATVVIRIIGIIIS
ncbi:MAG: hypothetical protein ACPLKQ_04620 [Candidatus Bathyarchaeales archaeon]